jgi:hypothetical protein
VHEQVGDAPGQFARADLARAAVPGEGPDHHPVQQQGIGLAHPLPGHQPGVELGQQVLEQLGHAHLHRAHLVPLRTWQVLQVVHQDDVLVALARGHAHEALDEAREALLCRQGQRHDLRQLGSLPRDVVVHDRVEQLLLAGEVVVQVRLGSMAGTRHVHHRCLVEALAGDHRRRLVEDGLLLVLVILRPYA